MKASQSFQSLLPSSTLYERMFRQKPYTKCVECLFESRLKCKKCMQAIIEEMTKKPKPKRNSLTHKFPIQSSRGSPTKMSQSRNQNVCNLRRNNSDKQNLAQTMVTSKYNWWLSEQVRKRLNQTTKTRSNWPRKLKNSDPNLQRLGAQQPLFERWQKKLVDQLTAKPQK